jgi:hypothetical protein
LKNQIVIVKNQTKDGHCGDGKIVSTAVFCAVQFLVTWQLVPKVYIWNTAKGFIAYGAVISAVSAIGKKHYNILPLQFFTGKFKTSLATGSSSIKDSTESSHYQCNYLYSIGIKYQTNPLISILFKYGCKSSVRLKARM